VANGAPAAAGTAPTDADRVEGAIRELAAAQLPHTPGLAAGMCDFLLASIPELAAGGDELRDETLASCESNVAQVLRMMRLGVDADALVVPVEAAEWARSLVRRGIPLATLLRGYRLGHAWFADQWSRSLRETLEDRDLLASAQQHSSAFVFAYIDRISDRLTCEYGSERDRLIRSAEQLRAETVRALVAGEAVDPGVASGRLGYELQRHHLALRVWSTSNELTGLEPTPAQLGEVLGIGDPLVVPAGAATLDVWFGAYERPGAEAIALLEAYAPAQGILVAAGRPGWGVQGFCSSHIESLEAARIVQLACGAGTAVTCFEQVELVALLACDLRRARSFVSSRLGPLASDSDKAARLRTTVLAFLTANGSTTRAAKELYLHPNTVAYRIRRAEEALGRTVTAAPLELGCALRLVNVLGRSVLSSDDDDRAGSAEHVH